MADIRLADRVELRKRVASLTRQAGRIAKMIVAVGGLVLVVLLQIPWLQSVLVRAGFDDPAQIGQVLIVALLVAVFFDVKSLMTEEQRGEDAPTYFSDPMDV